jgi:hypothetical protein
MILRHPWKSCGSIARAKRLAIIAHEPSAVSELLARRLSHLQQEANAWPIRIAKRFIHRARAQTETAAPDNPERPLA